MTSRRAWLLLAPVLAAGAVHLYVVWTIAAQPLGIQRRPPSQRSAIWNLHNDTVHRKGPGADTFAVYHAGVALQQDLDPYGPHENPQRTPYFFPFRYLPVVAQTLGAALSTLSPRAAYLLWLVILEATLCWLIVALVRHSGDRRLSVFSTCILLLSSPYFLELHMGQFTFVTLALVTIAVLLYERPTGRGSTLGGIACYTGAVLLKIFPLVAAPALLRGVPQRLSLAVAAAAVVAVSAIYFLAHPYDWGIFYHANLATPVGGMDAGNFGLVYLMYRFVDDVRPALLVENWAAFLTGWRLAILSASAVVVWLSREDRVALGVATMLLAHFVSYPHVWEHHMSGVIVIGLLALRAVWPDRTRASRIARAVLIAALVLLAVPTPFALFDVDKDPAVWDPSAAWPGWQRYVLVLSKAVPTLTLFCICIFLTRGAGWRRPRPAGGGAASDVERADTPSYAPSGPKGG